MHDQLLAHQSALTGKDLIRYAGELGLDIDQFTRDLRNHAGQAKIAADVDSADLSGVSGTPTFLSTASATTAPTTSAPFPMRCGRPRPGP
jgi:2-hydroxychromene-2-carboxylate isomerase